MVKKRAMGYLLQDIGLVLLLLCIGILSVTVGNARNEEQMEFFVMLMASFLAVLLAGFKFNSLSSLQPVFPLWLTQHISCTFGLHTTSKLCPCAWCGSRRLFWQ